MASLVDNPQIKSAELLTPLPLYLHAYVWPFAIVWPVFLRYYLTPSLYEKHIQSSEWTFVWCGAIITIQSLVWLSTNWSVNLKGSFTATKAKTVNEAQLIKVIPVANAGVSEICKINRHQVRSLSEASLVVRQLTPPPPGRRQDEHVLSVPKASLPLRCRDELLLYPLLCD